METSPSQHASTDASGTPTIREDAAEQSSSTTPEIDRLRAENERLQREVQALRDEPPGVAPERRHRARSFGMGLLVVLTSVSLVAATAGVWVDRTVWQTDRYVALVAPVADDPAVTNALAERLTNEAFEALDVQQRVEDAIASIPRAPDSVTFLTGPLVSGARTVVQRQTERFLASATFHELWVQLNRTLHTKIVALLEGNDAALPNVSVTGGEVRLNLVPAVAELLRRIVQGGITGVGLDVTIPEIPESLDASDAVARLGTALGVQLPPDFGQVTIMTEDQLTGYQETAATLKRVDGILVLATLVLLAACLLVATNRRRALIALGLGAVVGLLVGGAVIRRIEGRIVDGISAPGARAAAEDVFVQVSASLRHAGALVGLVALAVALIAYVAGRPRWLLASIERGRKLIAERPGGSELQVWVARHADPLRIASLVVGALVLFLTGLSWVWVAVVGTLLALALWGIAVAERRPVTVP